MHRILMFLLFVAMLLLTALFIAPLLVDQEGYKTAVVSAIKQSTGLDAQIGGAVSISFLPTPTVSVNDVAIRNVDGASSSNIIYVETVRVNASLQTLLSGGVDIKQITLIRPTIELEILKDGTQNWGILKTALQKRDVNTSTPFPDRISVVNALISYRTRDTKSSVDYISAQIDADSLNGPFKLKGGFSSQEQEVKFDGNIGELVEGTEAVFNMESNSFNFNLKGNYKGGKDSVIEGAMDTKIKNISQFLSLFFDNNSIYMKVKSDKTLDLLGKFSFSALGINFSDIAVTSEALNGTAQLEAMRKQGQSSDSLHWDITVALSKVDIDALLKGSEKAADGKDGEVDYYASTLNTMSLSDYRFDLPQNLSALFDITIKEVTYNQKKIEDVVISTDMFDGQAMIHEISAKLPGDSELLINGNIEHNGTRPLLHGKLALSGHNMRDMMLWLSPEVAVVPEGKLGEYMLTSDMQLTPLKIDLTNAHLSVDKSLFSGDATLRPGSTVPVINANLTVDRMNVDDYGLSQVFYDNAEQFIATAQAKTEDDKNLTRTWLQKLNSRMNLSLVGNNIVFNGYEMKSITATLNLARNVFNLQRLAMNSEIAELSTSLLVDMQSETPRFDFRFQSRGLDTAFFDMSQDKDKEKEKPSKWLWSSKPFNFVGIDRFNGKIAVAIRALRHKQSLVSNLILQGELKDRIFTIKKASANLYSGKVDIAGRVGVSRDNPSIGIKVSAQKVDFSPIIKILDESNNTQGTVYLSGTIEAAGISPMQWIANMKINSKFAGRDFIFNDFDLDMIVSKAQETYSAIDMTNIIKQASKEGHTLIDSIDGKLSSSKGILQLKDFQLANDYSRGQYAANISMADFSMNGVGRFYFKPDPRKKVYLGLGMKGNLSNIQKTLDSSDLEKYITDKGGETKKKP